MKVYLHLMEILTTSTTFAEIGPIYYLYCLKASVAELDGFAEKKFFLSIGLYSLKLLFTIVFCTFENLLSLFWTAFILSYFNFVKKPFGVLCSSEFFKKTYLFYESVIVFFSRFLYVKSDFSLLSDLF